MEATITPTDWAHTDEGRAAILLHSTTAATRHQTKGQYARELLPTLSPFDVCHDPEAFALLMRWSREG